MSPRLSGTRRTILACLGLAGALILSGCGGKEPQADDAVVVTDPTQTISTPGTAALPAAPASGGAATPAATTSPAPAENVKAEGWGTLKGQITFDGTPPPRKELVAKGMAIKDPTICAKDAPILAERLVVDAATKGVKNVLVYIPKPTAVNPESKSAAATAEVLFDQKGCIFEPHVLALMTGAKVLMKNSDGTSHNVNSKLKNNGGNQTMSAGAEVPLQTNAKENAPGEVVCDIHGWMKAYWLVTDSPYFAVTDDKGNFEIKNVPAGTQKVVVWQEAVTGGYVSPSAGQAVNIKVGDATTLDLKIEAGKIRPE